jgi:anti-sigma regulatory factor (Ser/Thr protein kinase)
LSLQAPKELRVPAELAAIERVRGFLREHLQGMEISEENAIMVELALHEILTNIARYAYPQGRGEMNVRIWSCDKTLYMEIRDKGIPFNPAGRPPLDLKEKIRQGTSGGLGVFLFKTLMDGHSYLRKGDENVLTIYKKL